MWGFYSISVGRLMLFIVRKKYYLKKCNSSAIYMPHDVTPCGFCLLHAPKKQKTNWICITIHPSIYLSSSCLNCGRKEIFANMRVSKQYGHIMPWHNTTLNWNLINSIYWYTQTMRRIYLLFVMHIVTLLLLFIFSIYIEIEWMCLMAKKTHKSFF